MRRPAFSILIAAHQSVATLPATLDSVLRQDYEDWEAIVVDDGSTDDTLRVAQAFAERDPRIVALSQDNAGTASARNRAAERAVAEWLCPLDADDLYDPSFLSEMMSFMRGHPDRDLYSCASWCLYPDGSTDSFDHALPTDRPSSVSLLEMIERNRLLAFTIVRRALFEQLGGFRDVYNEDWDLWLRALASGARHIHNPQKLTYYRRQPTGKDQDAAAAAADALTVLENLTAEHALGRQERAAVERMRQYYRSLPLRLDLEHALSKDEFRGARRAYLKARCAYLNRSKYVLGAILMILSPRLFRRAVLS